MNASINGANLYYEIYGGGDPLLMIQGWGADISNWQNVIEPLSKTLRLILFDNRGVGRSEVTPGTYTTRMLADDAAALLDHFQIPKTHVLGWSMGGMIAQELALAYPERINKLVLSATAAKVTEKSLFVAWSLVEAIERQEVETAVNWELSFCFSEELFANQALLAEVRESAVNPPYSVTPEGLISQFAAIASHDRRGQLGSLKAPTLVIGAEQDTLIRIDAVKSLAGEIKNAQLKIIPGAHMCHVENPAEFSQAVTEFLQK